MALNAIQQIDGNQQKYTISLMKMKMRESFVLYALNIQFSGFYNVNLHDENLAGSS